MVSKSYEIGWAWKPGFLTFVVLRLYTNGTSRFFIKQLVYCIRNVTYYAGIILYAMLKIMLT